MENKKYTTKDLAEGKICIEYKGNLERLQSIIEKIIPNAVMSGQSKHYYFLNPIKWSLSTDAPDGFTIFVSEEEIELEDGVIESLPNSATKPKKLEDLCYPDVIHCESKEEYNRVFTDNSFNEESEYYLVGIGKGKLGIGGMSTIRKNYECQESIGTNYTIYEMSQIIFPEVKSFNGRVVHCQSQEEWDFVIEKLKHNTENWFKSPTHGNNTSYCININLNNHACDLKYYQNNNYEILTFQEWCKEFNYSFKKEIKFEVGKWYKYKTSDLHYLKCSKSSNSNRIYYSEYINSQCKTYGAVNSSYDNDKVTNEEVSLEEIQQYLPANHPDLITDKISKDKPFYVVVTEENKEVLSKWRGCNLEMGWFTGKRSTGGLVIGHNKEYDAGKYFGGNEITFEQFLELYPECREEVKQPTEWWKDLKKGDVVKRIASSNEYATVGQNYEIVVDWETNDLIYYEDNLGKNTNSGRHTDWELVSKASDVKVEEVKEQSLVGRYLKVLNLKERDNKEYLLIEKATTSINIYTTKEYPNENMDIYYRINKREFMLMSKGFNPDVFNRSNLSKDLDNLAEEYSKAETLLERANRLYPVGTVYINVNTVHSATRRKAFIHYTLDDDRITDGCGGSVYCNGKWAKIVSKPGAVPYTPGHRLSGDDLTDAMFRAQQYARDYVVGAHAIVDNSDYWDKVAKDFKNCLDTKYPILYKKSKSKRFSTFVHENSDIEISLTKSKLITNK